MKALLNTLVITSVILTAMVPGSKEVIGNAVVAQRQKPVKKQLIPISLSSSVDVRMKDGRTNNGKLTAFDPKGKTIKIFRSGQFKELKISQLQQMTFDNKGRGIKLYNTKGQPIIIRGEDKAKANPSTWKDIPLNAFQLVDPQNGQAKVDLTTVVDERKLRGIQSVTVNSTYVADEIQFGSSGKMTIKVIPVDSAKK